MSTTEQSTSFSSFAFRSILGMFMLAATGPTAGAGGLLRSNVGSTPATSVPVDASAVTAAQASALAQRAQATLLRSNTVQQSLQAMQAAARAAAQAATSSVPNGLGTGGLQVAPGVPANLSNVLPAENAALWQGAQLPTQTTDTNGQTNVTITQTAQQALLTWQTYNIGKNTTLTYDQSAGGANTSQWIAFNKINDPSGNPSQILGAIKATGQVYVINQNGIIFGGSSQVNTHTLVASSLPINDNLVTRGLLNNPDTQFLFTALPQGTGANGPTPAFTPSAPLTTSGLVGDVVVDAGAQLSSPTNADKAGGRIALIGANVSNGGSISTPDGQAILAAGLQVGLAAHDGSDPSLRGLDVFVGSVGTYAGTATNTGLIDAPRANVIMAGKTLNQNGAVTSTTSASLNGRIDLLAYYNAIGSGGFTGMPAFFAQSTGNVSFGANSITTILPEWSSTERAVGTTLALPSQINVGALAVYLAPQALVYAPGANLTLSAGSWNLTGAGATAQDQFVSTAGQIYLDQGAGIDVGGSTNVAASVADNIISVQLLGAELANSHLQRTGALRGQTIQVDIRQTGTYNGTAWVGTPLADTSGYVALVDHTVGQLTTNGGTVNFRAGGSFVMQSGASINVAGGTTDYQGGIVTTTKVLSNGHIYDISQATPDLVYSGIYTGQSGTYEAGYIQGGNGGSISITAPTMALDGSLYGNTVAGPRQRTTAPALGSLNLVFQNQYQAPGNLVLNQSPTPPAISFQSAMTLAPADAFTLDASGNPSPLRADRISQVILSPSLFSGDGFGNVSINNSEGNIAVPIGSALTLQPKGVLTLQAANLDIADNITAPGGSLNFTVTNISLDTVNGLSTTPGASTPPPATGRGQFTLETGAVLSTAGLVVNDLATSSTANTQPLATAGGSILINAYDVHLGSGSLLEVAGGVAVSASGKYSYGVGGTLSIKAGQDPTVASVLGGVLNGGVSGAPLVFNVDGDRFGSGVSLWGYSGSKGGSLTLQAPLIQIGGTELLAGNTPDNTLWIQTTAAGSLTAANGRLSGGDFFTGNGFANITLNGLGTATTGAAAAPDQFVPAVRIAPGTTVAPVVASSYVGIDYIDPTGLVFNGLRAYLALQPVGMRPAASLTFNAVGVHDSYNNIDPTRGDLVVGQGVNIMTDPTGSVSLKGDTVDMQGAITALGGVITVTGGGNSNTIFPLTNNNAPLPTVVLGASSRLDAAGTTVLITDTTGHGYRTGSVLGGGSISVSGNIAALSGAVLDVSGASGVLDLDPAYTGTASNAVRVPTRVNSSGGVISFVGKQELFLDATLLGTGGAGIALVGESGGATASGGSLTISSGFYLPVSSTAPTSPFDVRLVVTQSGPVLPAYAAGQAVVGQPVLSAPGTAAAGLGYVAADTMNHGGFDALTLGGTVQFKGPVAISAGRSIRLADTGVVFADGAVTLSAPAVAIGTSLQGPSLLGEVLSAFQDSSSQAYYVAPAYGAGSLTITAANLINVGNLSLQGIGQAYFTTAGDISGSGTLDIAGNLTLRAGQVYPPTATTFTISASDYTAGGGTQSGTITVVADGTRNLPLSSGGTLNLYASIINQGGMLRAPLGTINLGWNGTGLAPIDLVTGQAVSVASQVTLASGGITSVSALDPVTGQALTIPYGINLNGTAWIDPSGNNITTTGVPAKQVNISGQSVITESGATVDINGGGNLYAYRFTSGVGGTTDILASSASFAVIPGYQADYAPFAAYNTSAAATISFGTDTGYTNSGLSPGDRVYLNGSNRLPTGIYTLLPARYALLPGAFLVTPKSGVPASGTVVQPDGSSMVTGYRFNDSLILSGGATPLRSLFEVASQTVVRTRAQYDDSLANAYFAVSAPLSRTPIDAGQLVLSATQTMSLKGGIDALAAIGGLGGLIDISSPVDIVIGGPGITAAPGQLLLAASDLSSYSGSSLLIGGIRSTGAAGTTVTVSANNLTVDNSGSPLSGTDIILVAKQNLTLADGADIQQTGSLGGAADSLLFGSATTVGSGDGALVRVSSDASASIARSGIGSASTASLTLGNGVTIGGGPSLILDSTGATTLTAGSIFGGQSVTLDSGRISLQLANSGSLQSGAGLVLTSTALASLQVSAKSLSLLSYSSIDIYGTGQVGTSAFSSLSLHSPSIRGFNAGGGAVAFLAQNILLDGGVGGTAPTSTGSPDGTLAFNASQTLSLGSGQLGVGQYADLALSAVNGILVSGSGGLTASGNLILSSPVLTGATATVQQITADGDLSLTNLATIGTIPVVGGLGANLTLTGAGVAVDGAISLPSGTLTLHATTGDMTVGANAAGLIDVGGTAKTFKDQTRFTNGGTIHLIADAGSVNLASGSTLSVAAQTGGGNAGTLSISAPAEAFTLAGTLLGQAGTSGKGGTFSLDANSLPGGSLAAIDASLNTGGFIQERDFRIRTGDVLVDGTATARNFTLSVDQGAITVTGKIDASGATGGAITLSARDSLTIVSGADLTVASQAFDNAGKGGAISLNAGSELNGVVNTAAVLDLQTGAFLDLSVANLAPDSAALGDFSGTLHLRAPQTASANDLQINVIDATILGASSIVTEGYKLFDLTASGGAITATTQANVQTNGTIFGGNTVDISSRLLANNASLAPVLHVQPGAEMINRTGNLTLSVTWDLSGFRFGPGVDPSVLGSGEAGNLTLQATGNLIFAYNTATKKFASLSDGFGGASANGLWTAPMLAAGDRSWSYTLVAGADLTSVGLTAVQSLAQLGVGSGSRVMGQGSPTLPLGGSTDALRATTLAGASAAFYQTIRTGTGDITINAGRDVQLLNSLASIYTAGTQAATMANFDTPNTTYRATPALGAIQTPAYGVYYSLEGGNVSISSQNDIGHFLQLGSTLTADSSAELPINWLYRRGEVDPVTGQFVTPTGLSGAPKQISSTSWWIDFSNFFEGVGALGGGNVTLTAGRNVTNVDAVAPTNARMPKGAPNASALVELGGGDVTVQAGGNIDGGVYYVERGLGTLSAGGNIITNYTRAAVKRAAIKTDPSTWLPTTLFLGKGSFDVSAGGNLLLGSMVNPFLLPQGINNSYFNKSYFTTYASTDAVTVSSLTGSVTLKSDPNDQTGSLANWFANVLYNDYPATAKGKAATTYAGYNEPWLRLIENNTSVFNTVAALLPATLNVSAFTGDVNLIGTLMLAPSPTGTLDILAGGSINGLQPNGLNNPSFAFSPTTNPRVWSTATINVSDANPASLPGVATPLSLGTASSTTPINLMTSLDALFAESGSTQGNYAVLQTQQALHDSGLLHLNDTVPLRLYAGSGDISGLTLYSPKATIVVAGRDITDVALYLQNISAADTSVVSAGRDLIAYDANSILRTQAMTSGNELMVTSVTTASPGNGNPTAGDIQVGGPGTLTVTAGRNLNLGSSILTMDGTATGITSIGNSRNPFLPTEGAAINIAAGLGGVQTADYAAFNALFLDPATAGANSTRYLPDLGALLGLTGATNDQIWTAFNRLSQEKRDSLSTALFYAVLRGAGRNHNDPTSVGYGNYAAGFAAITALFPGSSNWSGSLSLSSREITTTNGGAISVLVPGGGLSLGVDAPKNAGAPPGIITERGGSISIFARDSVEIGAQRIFTLRGGDVLVWSSTGNIAAGFSSKTVQSASPTRVLIDPQSGDVKTDLAGLATGGGIGVLATVAGVAPGNVDLIAPAGSIDAGDAGIRSSGNLNIAALQVINAGNIQSGGTSTGTPAAPAAAVSAPPPSPASESGSSASDLAKASRDQNRGANGENEMPSFISVEVLGYGGGDSSVPAPEPNNGEGDKKDEKKKDKKKGAAETSSQQLTRQDSSAAVVPPSV